MLVSDAPGGTATVMHAEFRPAVDRLSHEPTRDLRRVERRIRRSLGRRPLTTHSAVELAAARYVLRLRGVPLYGLPAVPVVEVREGPPPPLQVLTAKGPRGFAPGLTGFAKRLRVKRSAKANAKLNAKLNAKA